MTAVMRFKATLATGVLGGAAAIAVVVPAAPAQAMCTYSGGVTVYWANSPQRAKESAVSGTCNGDDIYRGKIFDIYTDGACVQAYYYESRSVQGVSCDSAGATYTYNDVNDDGYADWQMRTNKGHGDILRTHVNI